MSAYILGYRNYLEGLFVQRYETLAEAELVAKLPDKDQAVSAVVFDSNSSLRGRQLKFFQDVLQQLEDPPQEGDPQPTEHLTRGSAKARFLELIESKFGHIPLSAAPSVPAEGAPDATTQPAPATQETDMAKATKAAKKPKEKKAKAAKAPAAPKGPRALKHGMVFALKGHVLKNPSINDADLMTKLKKDGFSPAESSVATFRQDFVHSLRFLALQGYKVPQPGE